MRAVPELNLVSIFLLDAHFNVLDSHFFVARIGVNLQKKAIVGIQLTLEGHLSAEATVERDKTGSPPVRQVQPGFELSRVVRLGRLRQIRIITTISENITAGSLDVDASSHGSIIVLVTNVSANKVLTVRNDIRRIAFSLADIFVSSSYQFDNKVGIWGGGSRWNERDLHQAGVVLWRAQEGEFCRGDGMLMVNKTGGSQKLHWCKELVVLKPPLEKKTYLLLTSFSRPVL